MDALIRFAERGDVSELIAAACGRPGVLGVLVDVEPDWLRAWRAFDAGATEDAHVARVLARPFMHPVDFKWRPDWWMDHCYRTHRKTDEPFFLKVCLERGYSPYERPELPQIGVPVIFERRTEAELTASNPRKHYPTVVGGISAGVLPADPFTIGGIVWSGARAYGVTCAHGVSSGPDVDQPAAIDGSPISVGHVFDQQHPAANPGGTLCNPYSPVSLLNELDVALIELTRAAKREVLDVGTVVGMASKAILSPGQSVQVTGRTSSHQYLEIGALAAVYRMSRNGQHYCFKNLFELRQPYSAAPACRGGDSGAWVCLPCGPSKVDWAGMVVGADASIGYCTFAEEIEAWWTANGHAFTV